MDHSRIIPYVCTLLPEEILRNPPSQRDGISSQVERDHRFWGCELIQEAGTLLKLPQVVMVTAQTILHRFYYRKSLRDFDAFRVSFACLFLAAKVEEVPTRISEILTVFYAIYKRRRWKETNIENQLLDLDGDTYCQWRDWMILLERQLLIDLGFSIYNVMEHAHKYVLYYIKILDGTKELAQKAWGYANDSLRVDLMTRFSAAAIGCGSLFLAGRVLQIKLPDNPPWWLLFEVSQEEMVTIAREILQLYTRNAIEWLDPLTEINPFQHETVPRQLESADAHPIDTRRSEQPRKRVRRSRWSPPHPSPPKKRSAFEMERHQSSRTRHRSRRHSRERRKA
uniref:CyclinL1 putative n=1 Tax=Albugo laibachii Nc14 TaxID=890382 RepID=F0WDA4_9STRA|nr:cyclinL1 putative [Albugo laibachii Nc14]|eukprot:CCA19176.1 cyclinL1 putative [Albugo laibachii Nc14]